MKNFTGAVLFFLLVPLCACQDQSGYDGLSNSFDIVEFETNYEKHALAVDIEKPLFSWRMQSETQDRIQSAYQIIVQDPSGAVVWDSGKLNDSQSVAIEYQGAPLKANARYQLGLTIWDQDGHTRNTQSYFETGLMNHSIDVWGGAKWIGGNPQDKVFLASHLSVFRSSVQIQLDKESASSRAAYLIGGNDFRLEKSHLNLFGVENALNESFIAFELDLSGLDASSGQAQLKVYRVGYTPEDSIDTPLAVLPIPKELVNQANRYEPHQLYFDAVFGIFNIYIDGQASKNRLTEYNPKLPFFIHQGLNLNPHGRGGDFISYPMLGDIGFWVEPKQAAIFFQD